MWSFRLKKKRLKQDADWKNQRIVGKIIASSDCCVVLFCFLVQTLFCVVVGTPIFDFNDE